MTDLTIADLPTAATLTGSELVHIVQGGNSRQARLSNLIPVSESAQAASMIALRRASATIPYFRSRDLAKWIAARKAVQRGQARATLLRLGDSTDYCAFLPSVDDTVAAQMAARFRDLGVPALALSRFANGSNGAPPPFDLLSQDPAVLYDPTQWFLGGPTAGGYMFTGSNRDSSFIYRPREVTDSFRVRYAWYPGASLPRVSTDLGATWAVLPAGSAEGGEYMISAPILAPRQAFNSLWFSTSAPGQAVFLCGVNAWDSQSPAVDIFNLGACGWQTSDWVNDQAPWAPFNAIARLAPDLTMINLTINDAVFNHPDYTALNYVPVAKANLGRLIDVAQISGDAVLIVPLPSDPGLRAPDVALAYENMIRDLGAARSVPVIDRTDIMTNYAVGYADGDYVDQAHPSRKGARILGARDADLLALVGE